MFQFSFYCLKMLTFSLEGACQKYNLLKYCFLKKIKIKTRLFLKQLSHSLVDIQIVNKHIPQNFIREIVVKFYQTNKY